MVWSGNCWYLSDRQPTVRGIQGRVFQAKASGVIKVLRWDHAWCAPGTQSRSEQWNKESEVAQSYPTLRNSMDCRLPGSSGNSPWSFSGNSTGVGCHFLLQGIFPTQGLNLGLPALQAEALPSEPQGSPNNGTISVKMQQGVCKTRIFKWHY